MTRSVWFVIRGEEKLVGQLDHKYYTLRHHKVNYLLLDCQWNVVAIQAFWQLRPLHCFPDRSQVQDDASASALPSGADGLEVPDNQNNAKEATNTHDLSGNNGGISVTDKSDRTCISSNPPSAGSVNSDAMSLKQESLQSPDNSTCGKEVITTDVQPEHKAKIPYLTGPVPLSMLLF